MVALLGSACTDTPPQRSVPTAPEQIAPRGMGSDGVPLLDTLAMELRRQARSGARNNKMRATVYVDGAHHTLEGATAIADLERLQRAHVERKRESTHARATVAPSHLANVVDDSSRVVIVAAGSLVLTEPSKFRFKSYTQINKTTMAQFTFNAALSVDAISSGAMSRIWSHWDRASVATAGGFASYEWPSLTLTSGCDFQGNLTTRHDAAWPWGLITPGILTQHANLQNSAGVGYLHRDECVPPPPPPTPSPPPGGCLDETQPGCEPGGGTGGGTRAGNQSSREVARTSSGTKTVCMVTDWYENGRYIETTVNYCWTELIY